MEYLEADRFIKDEIYSRWPDWEPTATELSDWRYLLRRFDVDTAKQAVREHRIDSKWRRPIMKNIQDIATRLSPTKEIVRKTISEPTVFVQCVEHGKVIDARAALVKRRSIAPAYTCRTGTFYGFNSIQAGHEAAQRLTAIYGGKWEVIQEITITAMIARRKEFSDENTRVLKAQYS